MKKPLGNREILERISAEISGGTLSHAYIICAPAGGGKKTLAGYIANSVLCLENKNGEPCGRCHACAMLNGGGHPDLTVIKPTGDKEKSIKIDDIREAKASCYIKPVVGARRVFIVENAETMRADCQNALLKILEEPPEGTLFLLLTDNVERLLPTVRSRCVALYLPPLDEENIQALLPKSTRLTAEQIAAFSGGIAGDALYYSVGEGYNIYNDAVSFLETLCKSSVYEFLKYRDKIGKSRQVADRMLSCILKIFRDVCLMKEDVNAPFYFTDSREVIENAANKLTKKSLDNIINILQKLKTEAGNNAYDLKLCTMSALLLCWEEVH